MHLEASLVAEKSIVTVMIDESWIYFKHNDGKAYRMDDIEMEGHPE